MSGYGSRPFERGQTLFGGSPANATDGAQILGQEYVVFDDQHGTKREVLLRAVRNSANIAVLPKRMARLSADGTEIVGYTRLPSEKGFPIDELLPAAGCADNDICFVVVEGPALCLTSLSNYSADLAARDLLTSQTAATSQATTAGRVLLRAVVAATADATAGQRNVTTNDGVVGSCLSAILTDSTNADVLVDVANRVHT